MFTFFRPFFRYAGQVGWFDGRHNYPGEEQYQELVLYRPVRQGGVLAEPVAGTGAHLMSDLGDEAALPCPATAGGGAERPARSTRKHS